MSVYAHSFQMSFLNRLSERAIKKVDKKMKQDWFNKVYYKDAKNMSEIPNDSIHLIVTSPPYFNIKDYAKDGYQNNKHSKKNSSQIGDISDFNEYIKELLKVWEECERVLVPNGKLIINVPLMPMLKKEMSTHYNRHIFDINAEIQHSILNKNNTKLFLYDMYIWNRTNPSKSLMFGSYPYPRNFYVQNTIEFITVYVKDGKSINNLSKEIKEKSKLTQKEWIDWTKQIWNIPIPGRGDSAFGKHPAIMPEEIVYRCVRLFSFVGDIVLDPFTGSGTTLKIAKQLERNFIGYELIESYKKVIQEKISQ